MFGVCIDTSSQLSTVMHISRTASWPDVVYESEAEDRKSNCHLLPGQRNGDAGGAH